MDNETNAALRLGKRGPAPPSKGIFLSLKNCTAPIPSMEPGKQYQSQENITEENNTKLKLYTLQHHTHEIPENISVTTTSQNIIFNIFAFKEIKHIVLGC